jgi:hypothetical protein
MTSISDFTTVEKERDRVRSRTIDFGYLLFLFLL